MFFQVLVAPVIERGTVRRNIYLPDGGFQWQDSRNAQVFDGGTLLEDYPVALEEVAIFLRRRSWGSSHVIYTWPIRILVSNLLFYVLLVLFSSCTFPQRQLTEAQDFFLRLDVNIFILALYNSERFVFYWRRFLLFSSFFNFNLLYLSADCFRTSFLFLLIIAVLAFLYLRKKPMCLHMIHF